jgi:hypothetical protein
METGLPGIDIESLDALQRGLASAQDQKLARVVALLESLPTRGTAADGLIAPLRSLVAQRRTARPLTFATVLFRPLDPLIVPPAQWRPGELSIPRTVLQPLADTLRRALDPEAAALVDAAIGEASAALGPSVSRRPFATADDIGRLLWPAAGPLLSAVPPPQSWASTGLPLSAYPPLARAVGTVLSQTAALHALIERADAVGPPGDREIEPVLQEAAMHGPDTLGRCLVLLLDRAPHFARMLRAAARAPRLRAAASTALAQAQDFLLERLEADGWIDARLSEGATGETAKAVRRLAGLLDEFSDRADPERRQRVASVRQTLDQSCRKHFQAALRRDVLDNPLGAATTALPGAARALETAARTVRDLETAGRRVGGVGEFYDHLLRDAAQGVIEVATASGLELVDRVRLVEILAGPEDALALLERATSRGPPATLP